MDFNKYPGAYGYGGFFEQKPPAPPPIAKAPNVMNYGWGMTPGMPANMSNQYGGQWMVPPQSAAPHHQTFPKKTRGGFGYPGRGNKRPLYQQQPKPFDPVGKTPAMLLHELFKDGISEKYEEVSTPQAKKYKCVLTYGEQEYSHDANSKKVAKQKAAEVMIRGLRPEIQFTPFEETTSATPTKKTNAPPALNPYSQFVQPGAFVQAVPPPPLPAPMPPTHPAKKSGPPQKKAKVQVPALDAALSLVDALRKLCLERATSGPYNPSFEFEEISEPGVTEKFKKYVCILSFPEKNIRFTAEAVGRAAPKDLVCLKALKEEFGVTEKDIRAIMRRNVMGKGGTMPVVQTLHHVANLCHCTVVFKTETVEPSIGIGTGKQLGYTSELTLTDHTQNDKVVVMTGEVGMSKHEAKESVCRKMLKDHFDIDVDQVNETVQVVPPCQDLQVRCARKYKNNNSILFEDLGTVGVKDHASYGFKFKVVVEGKEFFGTGPSKKEAKNNAAREALACFFSGSPRVEEESEPEPCSRECHDLTQYVIKEHMNMRNFFGMHDQAPSRFAAFVFKNAEGYKRMVSLSAVSVPSVTSGELVINSDGTVLHHMDSIVLARRGLIRYLIANMEQFDAAAPNNVLERTASGKFRVRDDMQLILYTSFAPPLQNCKLGTEKPSLPLFGASSMEMIVPQSPVTMEEIIVNKNVTCHSPSDKILKWTHLGVQGALLSLIMEPVLLSRIYVASRSNILSNDDLMHAFFTRTGEPTREVHSEFASNWFIPYPGPQKYSYVKLEPTGTVEQLEVTGKQADGEESILSKRSIYRSFLEIYPELARDMPYQSAKAQATEYNSSKHMLYLHMENRGYGKWQTKPSELSNFSLDDAAPTEIKSEDTSKIDFSLDA